MLICQRDAPPPPAIGRFCPAPSVQSLGTDRRNAKVTGTATVTALVDPWRGLRSRLDREATRVRSVEEL